MTETQRDRLAAVLHDAICPLNNVRDAICCDWHEPDADALLARGVRVVDESTLMEAVGRDHFRHCDDGCGFSEFTDGGDYATRLLAAIDDAACPVCDEGKEHPR